MRTATKKTGSNQCTQNQDPIRKDQQPAWESMLHLANKTVNNENYPTSSPEPRQCIREEPSASLVSPSVASRIRDDLVNERYERLRKSSDLSRIQIAQEERNVHSMARLVYLEILTIRNPRKCGIKDVQRTTWKNP